MKIRNEHTYALIAVFTLVYILLPSHNSGIDAYAYAAQVKYGVGLFQPHHLLYNATLYVFYAVIGFGTDVLSFMKIANAIAGGIALYLFSLIILRTSRNTDKTFFFTLFVASTYGFWRYTTENETYIFPLVFSLAGSYSYLLYLESNSNKQLLLTSLCCSVACLYHQLHVWWWLAIGLSLLFSGKRKESFYYTLPALIVPLVYLVIFIYERAEQGFSGYIFFIFEDYLKEKAGVSFGGKALVLTLINAVRSNIQIHGNMLYLLKTYPALYLIPALIAVIMPKYFLEVLVSGKKYRSLDPYEKTHLLALILFSLFAFLSNGNAEFMVMFPFLGLVVTSRLIYNCHFRYISYTLLAWNFCFGIMPQNLFQWTDEKFVLKKYTENTSDLFILTNKPHVENMNFYATGIDPAPRILKNPAALPDSISLTDSISTYIKKGAKVYTNCIQTSAYTSRKTMVENNSSDKDFFSNYYLDVSDSVALPGMYSRMYEVRIKQPQ